MVYSHFDKFTGSRAADVLCLHAWKLIDMLLMRKNILPDL